MTICVTCGGKAFYLVSLLFFIQPCIDLCLDFFLCVGVKAAIKAGFPASKIVYAGVGKTDKEINLGLDYDIFCFNVESIPELEVINELAAAKNKIARVAFRINPDVGAHTHANITTGLAENKFGLSL